MKINVEYMGIDGHKKLIEQKNKEIRLLTDELVRTRKELQLSEIEVYYRVKLGHFYFSHFDDIQAVLDDGELGRGGMKFDDWREARKVADIIGGIPVREWRFRYEPKI